MTHERPASEAAPLATRRWWRISLYPLVVPVAFILVLWASNAIHPVWLIRPVVVTSLALALLTLAFAALLDDPDRGAIAAFAIGLALIVTDLRAGLLLGALTVLIVAEGLVHRSTPWRYGRLVNRVLSTLCLAFLVVTVLGMIGNGAIAGAVSDVQGDIGRSPQAATYQADAPDIWLILLDGYPGDDAATRAAPAGWDAEAFPAALEQRGFVVQRHSRANYLITRLVLASMFGDDHLAALGKGTRGLNLAAQSRVLREMTETGPIIAALGQAGYDRTVIASDWAEVGPRRVDRLIDLPEMSEFELVSLRATGAGRILDRAVPDLHSADVRSRILDTFTAAERLAAEPHDRPRFVFVHIPAPHTPAVFDATGNPVNGSTGSTIDVSLEPNLNRDERSRRMFNHSTYIGQLAIGLVDAIHQGTARPKDVVLFSDHGTDIGFDPNSPLTSDLDERSSNLLAASSQDGSRLLPQGTTPITILPRLLDAELGLTLPIRPDTSWSWRNGADILDLVELDPATWKPRDGG